MLHISVVNVMFFSNKDYIFFTAGQFLTSWSCDTKTCPTVNSSLKTEKCNIPPLRGVDNRSKNVIFIMIFFA